MNFDTLTIRNFKRLPDGSAQIDVAYGLTAVPGGNAHASDLPSAEVVVLPPELKNAERLANFRVSADEIEAWLAANGRDWNLLDYLVDRAASGST